MDRRKLLATGSAAAAAAAAGPAAALAGGNGRDGIVGSWLGTVTATNPPLGSFNDLITFHDDGTVLESRRYLVDTPFGRLLETTGHGAWKRSRGGRGFEAFFRFLLQNHETTAPFGTDNIRLSLELDRHGNLTGTFVSQIQDESGATELEVTGTYTATPIEV